MEFTGVDNLEALTAARNYNNFLTEQIGKYCKCGATTLDFGAGIGTYSLALTKMGFDMVCVEPDPNLYQRLSDYGLEVSPNLASIDRESLDYVFSINVLEHIQHDSETLGQLYERLRPGGYLLVYVPAFNLLYSSMDRKVGHLRRYTMSGLVALMQRVGFVVNRADYVDSLGFFASLVYRVFGSSDGEITYNSVKLYDTLLFPISRIMDRIFKRVFGKNLLIEAHRPRKARSSH